MAENSNYQGVKDITDLLEAGIQDLFSSEKYMTWLRTMSKFHDYSLNNTLLITLQKPEATLVAGYTAWQKQFGRQVLKGEKGIKIIAPTTIKKKVEVDKLDSQTQQPILDEHGDPVKETCVTVIPSFKVVNVFDVSQTEGRELPTIGVDELSGNVQQFDTLFEALKLTSPVSLDFEQINGGAKGFYDPLKNRIVIQEGMSQVQTIKTAIHEISHAMLHGPEHPSPKPEWKIVMVSEGGTKVDFRCGFSSEADAEASAEADGWRFVDENAFEWRLEIEEDHNAEKIVQKNRQTKEAEAERVAYTVCQHYGIDTSDYSFAYIAGWSQDRDASELKSSLNTIRETASEMITKIDLHMKDLQKAHTAEAEHSKASVEEAVFLVGNSSFLEIHIASDGMWDYSLYDTMFSAVDGGRIGDSSTLDVNEACSEILKAHGLTGQKLTDYPRDEFERKLDAVSAEQFHKKEHAIPKMPEHHRKTPVLEDLRRKQQQVKSGTPRGEKIYERI